MKNISKEELEALRNSNLFNEKYYLEQYPDVKTLGMDPLEHYLWVGKTLGRKISKNSAFEDNDRVKSCSQSKRDAKIKNTTEQKPFLKNANLDEIRPYFDEEWYITQFPYNIVPSDPLGHFEKIGWRLGLSPNRWFDTLGYVSVYKDVARAGSNPFVHFLKRGKHEGRSPDPFFVNRRKRNPSLNRIWASEYGNIEKIILLDRQGHTDTNGKSSICVHLHAYYIGMIDDLTLALRRISRQFTLLVSIPYYEETERWQNHFKTHLPKASKIVVKSVENRGRDVAPWLIDFRDEIRSHDLFFHFHTKRSHHASEHRFWFRFLNHTTLGSQHVVDQIIETFETDPSVGLIAPGYWPELRRQPNFGAEEEQFRALCQRMGISQPYEDCPDFPAGSFFWCKTRVLEPLFALNLGLNDFPEENGQVAGTLAHAIERVLGALPSKSSMRVQLVAVDRSHDQAEHQSVDVDGPLDCGENTSLKVSVVMPTWNRRHTLQNAIRSALGQSYRPYEIIVVDDGSTDGTLDFLKEAFRAEIQSNTLVIAESDHKGVSNARNVGLDKCNGDIITYLDSDNTWRNDYLKHIVAAYEKFPHALSIYTDFLSHDVDLGKTSHYNRSYNRSNLLDKNFIDLNVFSHKRTYVDDGYRFDTKLKRLVDWDLIIRITANRAPLHIKYIGADYNLDEHGLNNITRTVPLDENLERVRAKHRKERVYWGHDRLNIVIKCPAPNESVAHQWGDYHFAKSLCRSFERLGCTTRIDLLCDWENQESDSDDVVLVLRGLSQYRPKPGRINLMWLISHPDKVSLEEMRQFDHVFVASHSFTRSLVPELKVNVSSLLQCSDPELFYREINDSSGKEYEVIFVGNSRRVDRWMPRVCVERGLPIQVYGADWDGRIPKDLVKSDHIPNDLLGGFYNSSKIVLNDHWPDMAKNGFISNRIFDAAMSGALVVSDNFDGSEIFFGNLICCESASDVEKSIKYYLRDDLARTQKASNLQKTVLMNHTFDRRAEEILKTIGTLMCRMPVFGISMGVPTLVTDDCLVG